MARNKRNARTTNGGKKRRFCVTDDDVEYALSTMPSKDGKEFGLCVIDRYRHGEGVYRPERDPQKRPLLYRGSEKANEILAGMPKGIKSHIRLATEEEIQNGVIFEDRREELSNKKTATVATKKSTDETVCLVDIFCDTESRKFAVRTQADDEGEFLSELAKAMSRLPQVSKETQEIRYRELLALSADLVCKYRGYKSTVREEKVLIAGDLVMPSEGSNGNQQQNSARQ